MSAAAKRKWIKLQSQKKKTIPYRTILVGFIRLFDAQLDGFLIGMPLVLDVMEQLFDGTGNRLAQPLQRVGALMQAQLSQDFSIQRIPIVTFQCQRISWRIIV